MNIYLSRKTFLHSIIFTKLVFTLTDSFKAALQILNLIFALDSVVVKTQNCLARMEEGLDRGSVFHYSLKV